MTTAPANFAVEDHRWFHAIDLGDGVVTLGRFQPGTPPKYTLFGFFDLVRGLSLEGARCVDVGTMDGIGGFVMKAMGAAEVIATELASRDTWRYARQQLDLAIDYRTPVQVMDLPSEIGARSADVILMAGVLYCSVNATIYFDLVATYLARRIIGCCGPGHSELGRR